MRQNKLTAESILVYLVDDDRGMVSSTSQWLSLSGIRVQAFADPTALMKVVKAGHPCVVVSDIRMPGIDGMELMKLIKGRDRHIPVILITGHGDIPLAVEAMKQGAYEFLSKPFSPEKLLETVQSAQASYIQELERNEAKNNAEPIANPVEPEVEAIPPVTVSLPNQVDDYEKNIICKALARHDGSIARAIEELGIPRRTLNAKMKRYGISRRTFR